MHRTEGPALIQDDSTSWYLNGKLHRIGAPAVEYENGNVEWWLQGVKHRVNGPAIINDQSEQWWSYGNKHCITGAAITHPSGEKEWWISGVQYSEEEFNHIIGKEKLIHSLNHDLIQKITKAKLKL